MTKYERDRESFLALLWQLDQLCSAVLRRPAYEEYAMPSAMHELSSAAA